MNVILLMLLAVIQTARTPQVSRVTDQTGQPIEGVSVMNWQLDEARTDQNGRFTLPRGELLRFSKEGHEPRTVPANALDHDVVLRNSLTAVWSAPTCTRTEGTFGSTMRFVAPRNARIARGRDVDYETVRIRHGKAVLLFGMGPSWGGTVPDPQTLAAMVEVRERDIPSRWGFPLAEYRGRRVDGTRWRDLRTYGQSITYDHADDKAAAYFDAIIDTLCLQG